MSWVKPQKHYLTIGWMAPLVSHQENSGLSVPTGTTEVRFHRLSRGQSPSCRVRKTDCVSPTRAVFVEGRSNWAYGLPSRSWPRKASFQVVMNWLFSWPQASFEEPWQSLWSIPSTTWCFPHPLWHPPNPNRHCPAASLSINSPAARMTLQHPWHHIYGGSLAHTCIPGHQLVHSGITWCATCDIQRRAERSGSDYTKWVLSLSSF